MSLYSCRKRAGLTQQEVADALCVTCAAVSYWDNGINCPTGRKLRKLAELYQCTVDELLSPEEGKRD